MAEQNTHHQLEELPSCDDVWEPTELSEALARMQAAADRLMAEAIRSPWGYGFRFSGRVQSAGPCFPRFL